MSENHKQIERLTAKNARLKERIAELEKESTDREYRQGLKERKFWVKTPSLWFSIAEAEFKVAGIVDDTLKYNYVVSQLDKEESDKVIDIINSPPAKGKYEKIKEELKRRLAEPEQERLRMLFEEKLGNKTPSQFYRYLQSLAGVGITVDKLILHLWMRQLPKYCQQILASRPEESNSKLAELADHILEATKNNEIPTSTPAALASSRVPTIVDNIQQSMDELCKQVVALQTTVKESRSISTCQLLSPSRTPNKTCWYHQQWGSQAFRCISPCSWKKLEKEEEEEDYG